MSFKNHRLLTAFLCALFLLASGRAALAEDFLSAMPDMPLAAGLAELEDGALVFDKPEGRIVQVTALRDSAAATQNEPQDIARFYRRALPNLGWLNGAPETGGRLTFTRKGETLRITISADLVIFDLAPSE